jgi:hypothetical protein
LAIDLIPKKIKIAPREKKAKYKKESFRQKLAKVGPAKNSPPTIRWAKTAPPIPISPKKRPKPHPTYQDKFWHSREDDAVPRSARLPPKKEDESKPPMLPKSKKG